MKPVKSEFTCFTDQVQEKVNQVMKSEENLETSSCDLQCIEVCEEESCSVPIRAATLEKLVEYCIDEFDAKGPKAEPVLSKALFTAHQWFVESEKLLETFLDVYLQCITTNGTDENCNTDHTRKIAVCQCINYWMSRYGSDFRRNDELSLVAKRIEAMVGGDDDETLKDIIQLSNAFNGDARYRALSNPPNHKSAGRKASLAFQDQYPEEIADQLTYLEFRLLRRIPFSEWKEYAITSKLENTPYLERYVAMFNGLSKWIQAMVLNHTSAEDRASCIEKFQKVAKHLKELQNYNGLLAVTGGLNNSVLARLHQTREYTSKDCREYLNLLTEFLSSENNYSTYRKRLSCGTEFSIPILGIQLKDLIATHTALPDRVNGNLINVHKLMMLAAIISRSTVVQTIPPPVSPNTEMINMLRVSLQPRLSEDELYELSLAREPRTMSMSSNMSNTSLSRSDSVKRKGSNNSILFADWASGASNVPDRRVFERHVAAMVEAVFRVYDLNKDGCISGQEFDAIATNFPFIDPFGVIDVNCDGIITKDEMKNYFLKVNCQNLTREFSHNFQETTYFTPTFCFHCGGLLRGIIKQGTRCKDCHINCHKSCKKELVVECRNRSPTHNMSTIDRAALKADRLRGRLKSKIKFYKQPSEESLKSQNGDNVTVPSDFYERLLKAEESRDQLLMENAALSSQLEEADGKIDILQSHLDLLRQNTVTFILDQMDALQMQKVTEV